MQNIDDYDEFIDDHEHLCGGHPYGKYEELDCIEDGRVLIDYNDFVALAQSDAKGRTTINYILRALRLGVEPSVILAIFDEDTGNDIDELLTKPESPFYIPGNDEDYEK